MAELVSEAPFTATDEQDASVKEVYLGQKRTGVTAVDAVRNCTIDCTILGRSCMLHCDTVP